MGEMPVTRIFLVPSWISRTSKGSLGYYSCKGIAVSNEGAYSMYCPFGFPISGNYSDYGRIEPNSSHSLDLLLKFFNVDYKTLETAAEDDRWIRYAGDKMWELKGEPKNVDILKRLTYCDIYTPVYESLIELATNSYDKEWLAGVTDSVKECIEDKTDAYGFRFSQIKILPFLCGDNFIKLFITEGLINLSDLPKVDEMVNFAYNVSRAKLILRPSHYGGQDDNHKIIFKINEIAKRESKKFVKEREW